MIISNFDDSIRKGYLSPTAEEIAIEQSSCLCESQFGLEIPDTTETEGYWD